MKFECERYTPALQYYQHVLDYWSTLIQTKINANPGQKPEVEGGAGRAGQSQSWYPLSDLSQDIITTIRIASLISDRGTPCT